MANVKISALTELTAVAAADVMLITDDSEASVEKSKKVKISTMQVGFLVPGTKLRSRFSWKDTDEISIEGGYYDVNGKIASIGSKLTKQLSGSSASTRYYLYLDESGITSTTPITATELIWSTSAPSWSDSLRGWYNASDRCIFGVITNAAGHIAEFFHSGDFVQYADQIIGGKTSVVSYDFTTVDVDTSWVDCYLPIPGFAVHAKLTIYAYRNGANAVCISSYRTNGQTGSTGHQIAVCLDTVSQQYNTFDAISDATQIIEVINSASNAHTISVYANGWYFPVGM
jgi:hypothetical protein